MNRERFDENYQAIIGLIAEEIDVAIQNFDEDCLNAMYALERRKKIGFRLLFSVHGRS